jgi:hypothetical protein
MLLGSIISVWTLGGLAFGVLGVCLLPVLAIVVGVLLYRRTKGQQPSTVVTVPGLNKQVDLGIFSGLVAAARSGDQKAVLQQVQLLAIRAGDAGGIEALVEKYIYDTLEQKLATHERTPTLSAIAELLGVNERSFLDLVEGKTAAAAAPAVTAPAATSSAVIPIATPLVALAIFLGATGGMQAADQFGRLTSPQRFYPAEVEPVVDPPTFRSAARYDLAPQGPNGRLIAPNGAQPPYQQATVQASTGRRFAPVRWLFRCR